MAFSNKLTYHRRLFLGLIVYSVILVGSFAVFQYFREKEFKADELNMQLQMVNAEMLEALDSCDTLHPRHFAIPEALGGLRVSVIDLDGNVVYDNTLDSLPGTNHLDRKEIAEAISKGEGFVLRRHSASDDRTYFYSARRGGDYIVRTAVPYTVTLNQLLEADYGFLFFMFGMTAVMCVIGYFATRKVGIHLERLRQFAARAENGERITDSDPFPHDELGDISNHIVRLYARLQQAVADRDREHQLAIMQEQEKIRIKRQLTNNINHELKTPVASMQVCLETLMTHKEMSAEKRDEFIARCYRANERLGKLLVDVAAVTRLDDGGKGITVEDIDVADIAAEVCDEFAVEAEVAGIRIENNVTCHSPLRGNAEVMASVFRNLIVNAIAYSHGSHIYLRQQDGEEYLTIIVEDDGVGVDEEHLPRLFERFYRVDKGRSRKAGGTGLGLSIVRNAVMWHGGTVRVENRRGGGLAVIFTVRKAGERG